MTISEYIVSVVLSLIFMLIAILCAYWLEPHLGAYDTGFAVTMGAICSLIVILISNWLRGTEEDQNGID